MVSYIARNNFFTQPNLRKLTNSMMVISLLFFLLAFCGASVAATEDPHEKILTEEDFPSALS